LRTRASNARTARPEGAPGIDCERACERHALPLATGELLGVAVGQAVQLHEIEKFLDLRADLLLRTLPDLEAEGHVLADGHVGERGVVLENEADLSLLGRKAGRLLTEDEDVALVRVLEPRDHPEERGFSASARSEERRQRAACHRDRDVLQRGKVAEPLGHATNRYRHGASTSTMKGKRNGAPVRVSPQAAV
jgi:hypothetical protein